MLLDAFDLARRYYNQSLLYYNNDDRKIRLTTLNFSHKNARQNLLRTSGPREPPVCLSRYSVVSNARNTPFALSCNYAKRMDNRAGETDGTSR